MSDNTEVLEQLRALNQEAEKDKDLDDRLRMDRAAVWREKGIDVDKAERAIAQLREDRIEVWQDVLKDLEARGTKKS